MKSLSRNDYISECGASLVEYSILVSLVMLIALAGVQASSVQVQRNFYYSACILGPPGALGNAPFAQVQSTCTTLAEMCAGGNELICTILST